MNIFTLEGAEHYCRQFQPNVGTVAQTLEQFKKAQLSNRNAINEGAPLFDQYRCCALRDVERYLFLAASHYRRALDLMVPSSSHWAHVTLYYGTWFAAHALLGMFGCSVLGEHVVHVSRSSPGQQRLQKQRMGSGVNHYSVTENGSHRRFWQAFYRAAGNIRQFLDAQVAASLNPVANDIRWLSDQRNKINYELDASMGINSAFASTFLSGGFPNSLPGELNSQYTVCEGILVASYFFAEKFGLSTDALDQWGPPGTIKTKVLDTVYSIQLPDLEKSTKKHDIFAP